MRTLRDSCSAGTFASVRGRSSLCRMSMTTMRKPRVARMSGPDRAFSPLGCHSGAETEGREARNAVTVSSHCVCASARVRRRLVRRLSPAPAPASPRRARRSRPGGQARLGKLWQGRSFRVASARWPRKRSESSAREIPSKRRWQRSRSTAPPPAGRGTGYKAISEIFRCGCAEPTAAAVALRRPKGPFRNSVRYSGRTSDAGRNKSMPCDRQSLAPSGIRGSRNPNFNSRL